MEGKDWVLLTDQAGDLYDRLKEVLPCSSPLLERAYQRYRRRQSKKIDAAVKADFLKIGDKVLFNGQVVEVYAFVASKFSTKGTPKFRYQDGREAFVGRMETTYTGKGYYPQLAYIKPEDQPTPKAVVSSITPRVLKVEKVSVFAGGKKYVPNWQVKVIANGLVLYQSDKEHLAYERLGKLEKRVSEIGIQELIKEVRSAEVS